MKHLIIIFLILSHFNYCYGCDCDNIIGKKEANKVFIGRVVDIKRIDNPFRRYEIVFSVSKYLKGISKIKTIVVNIPCLNVGCCGIPVEINDNYLVYTYMRKTSLGNLIYTDECTETRKIKDPVGGNR